MSGVQFDDPNRESIGLAPIWEGAGEPPPEPEGKGKAKSTKAATEPEPEVPKESGSK